MEKYDICFLGSGPGGYVGALRAAQLGANVVVVEKGPVGGVCLNRGCIPTKALLASAKVLGEINNAATFGVKVGSIEVDFGAVSQRKEKIVSTLRKGIETLFKSRGATLVRGEGRLSGPNEVSVKTAEGEDVLIHATNIVLATGSEPLRMSAFPFDGERVITSDEALQLEKVPGSVLIIGAGAIGCEFASIFQRFGAEVTVVELLDRMLPGVDEDLSEQLFRSFKRRRMSVHTSTKVETLTPGKDGVKAKLSSGKELDVDMVLVAVGRKLNTDDIGLETVGIETERGVVPIDENCRTPVKSVYAIGDITGKWLLAHYASRQGIVVAHHLTGGEARINDDVVPNCIFTEPEVASVGLTEQQASERGMKPKSAKFPFRALGRAHVGGEVDGFVKMVSDEETEQVVGVHIIGPMATDLIAEAALAIQMEATAEEIADTIHAHPTHAESMMEAAEMLLGLPTHVP